MTSLSAARRGVHRISGPAELLQAVPYLLGFRPTASLVLVGLCDALLVVTARLDLVDAAVDGVLDDTVAALERGGSSELVAAVYPEADGDVLGSWRGLAERIDDAALAAGCELRDVLVVVDRRWRSAWCEDEACCPSDGMELPGEPSAFAAAATVDGVVPLDDRDALAASLEPVPASELVPLELIDAAEDAVVNAALEAHSARHRRRMVRELLAAAREAEAPGWPAPAPDAAARWAVALTERAVLDEVWLAVDARRADGRALWRALARRLPDPYRAAPLFLFGWASWRDGNGALAGMAAERAVDSDPLFTPADLLQAAVSNCVDPRRMPPLRLPKRA